MRDPTKRPNTVIGERDMEIHPEYARPEETDRPRRYPDSADDQTYELQEKLRREREILREQSRLLNDMATKKPANTTDVPVQLCHCCKKEAIAYGNNGLNACDGCTLKWCNYCKRCLACCSCSAQRQGMR